MSRQQRPPALYMLFALVLFQAIGALFGGFSLIIEPSGTLLQMSPALLEGSPFKDFLIPGLALGFLLGVFPAFISYGLLARPNWRWAGALNIYPDRHWAWTYSLYLGIMLIFWIDVQVMAIGYWHIIQSVYAFLGLIILTFTLMPGVMAYFARR